MKNINLTSTEISALWATYINDCASVCFLKHFSHHVQDAEIKPILKEALSIGESHIKAIKELFQQESFPVPKAFSDEDLNLSAPPLYTDLYALSYVYGMSRIGLISYGTMYSNIAREDVMDFFAQTLHQSAQLYRKSVNLMLSKGIYDRPPKIPYPESVTFVEKESYLNGWLGELRPLNAIELTEIFFNIERNYFGVLLLTGLLQVTKDEEIKKHLMNGKQLAEKQIKTFNNLLLNEELLGTVPVAMEVTTSTTSPFSDKLIMFTVNSLYSAGITTLGHSIAVSTRRDLSAQLSKYLTEVLSYGDDGVSIMIERGWLEQPPQAPNRRQLMHV
ncbi:hypothetical protein PAECIP111802_05150 [Paenibacillus allorhizosphaerae]|uniref:DUF3231 family protein n=1 Tax=Paenibacillus allorhizosphaerae TaxID=2849866 RepID=A0ABM8VNX4_9BACL|nr:hypothetical protein PAECIP111802_05150 [Paenibacillus allorhizosphaerae]